MTDSELLDFSSRDFGEPADERSPRQRRRARLLTVILVLFFAGVAAFGGWLQLTRVHDTDLAVFANLRQRFELVDRTAQPLLHGESPPCEQSEDTGIVTRTYSPESGPTVVEVRNALRLVGFWAAATTPGSIYTMDTYVDGHRLVVEVIGQAQGPDARGFTLRATSPATSLACLVA